MSDFEFLDVGDLLAIQDRMIRIKGLTGEADVALLEMAVARPINAVVYGEIAPGDIFSVAAEYAYAISTLHGFRDANKRTAYGACLVFLLLNGVEIIVQPDEVEAAAEMIVALAQRKISTKHYADWLRQHAAP